MEGERIVGCEWVRRSSKASELLCPGLGGPGVYVDAFPLGISIRNVSSSHPGMHAMPEPIADTGYVASPYRSPDPSPVRLDLGE